MSDVVFFLLMILALFLLRASIVRNICFALSSVQLLRVIGSHNQALLPSVLQVRVGPAVGLLRVGSQRVGSGSCVWNARLLFSLPIFYQHGRERRWCTGCCR